MRGAQLMHAHLSRGLLTPSERMSPAEARLARAGADPMFAARVTKAAAKLRKLDTARGRALAAGLADAVQVAEATGAALPTILEDAGLLRQIL